MTKSNKYTINNNQGNVSIDNQGHNPQSVTITADKVSSALNELRNDVGKIEDENKKEIAEANLELLDAYIETKNREKATGVLEKLKNLVGNTSSLITIGTFLASL